MIVAAPAVAPAAAGAAGITVRVPGGERRFTAEEIAAAADTPAGSYVLRAAATAGEPVAHPPALSVRGLITRAGASPDALSFVSIERPNGSLARLGRGDLTEPPPFPEGPAIVWMDAGGARYLRPLRGPDDANGTDNIGITGADLVVRVHQGPLIVVRARAGRRTVRAGDKVHLSAEVVSGAAPGASLTFSWRFGDGTGKTGKAVNHVFKAEGVYEAVVTVDGSDDSGGSSDPMRIRVGAPRKGGGDTGGGTGDRRRAPAQGPADGDDDGGTTTQTPTPAPSTTATPAPAPAPPTPAATTPSTSREPAPAPRRARPARRRARPERRRPSGELVRGTLVAARTPTALPGGAPAPSTPAAARRGTDPGPDRLGPAAGILLAIALVGLGIRRERRALRARPEVS